jgi:caffeoyl-CoA O-methyltransferase
MDFISPVISAYAEAHTIQEDELLSRVNRETHLQVNMPRMLSGHLQGRFLALISKLIQPELIVELGTYTG